MTRDARLSALHRGDFWPGAALPSPALPPDTSSELLAARSSCLAGGVPDLPSPRAKKAQLPPLSSTPWMVSFEANATSPAPDMQPLLRAAAAGRHSPLRLRDRL